MSVAVHVVRGSSARCGVFADGVQMERNRQEDKCPHICFLCCNIFRGNKEVVREIIFFKAVLGLEDSRKLIFVHESLSRYDVR